MYYKYQLPVSQVVMNLCMDDWQKLKDSLEVRRALISRF